MVDQDCVRVLLLYLGRELSSDNSGNKSKRIKLKAVISQSPLDGYPPNMIYDAASYIVLKGYALIAAKQPKLIPHVPPVKYQFTALTASGLDLVSVLQDESAWDALKKRLGSVFDASLSQILAAGAQLGLDLILR